MLRLGLKGSGRAPSTFPIASGRLLASNSLSLKSPAASCLAAIRWYRQDRYSRDEYVQQRWHDQNTYHRDQQRYLDQQRWHDQDRYRQDHYRYHDQQQYEHDDHQSSAWEYKPDGSGKIKILRPIIWSVVFCGGAFLYYANKAAADVLLDHAMASLIGRNAVSKFGLLGQNPTFASVDNDVFALVGGAHRVIDKDHAQTLRKIARWPAWVPLGVKRSAVSISDMWYGLSNGQKVVFGIVGINTIVLGLWKIPRLVPFMARHFLHDPRTGRSYTLLTSTFSHQSVTHFFFNNWALVSFGLAVSSAMGADHFTAFYLSAGVLSSLASHLAMAARWSAVLPSLGASGAIYAVVAATMVIFPNAGVQFIFFPFVPITISQAFPLLMAVDALGIVLRWRTLNHVAHFAGGALGLSYMYWGVDYWRDLVKRFINLRLAMAEARARKSRG